MIVNLSTWSDADFIKAFAFKDSLGTPISLVGNLLTLKVRSSADSETLWINIDSGTIGGIVLTSAVNGLFEVTIPRARLGVMAAGPYVHSLVRRLPDARIKSMWHGDLTHRVGPGR